MIAMPIIALIFWVGLYPATILDITSGSVAAVVKRIQDGPVAMSALRVQPSRPDLVTQDGSYQNKNSNRYVAIVR